MAEEEIDTLSVEPQVVEELCWTEKELPQKERTKHVHGLHPYLGKYVPQLVDYFIDRYFRELKSPAVLLDPFVGSGTTLVEANIKQIDSLGIDVSAFNVLLSKVKTNHYDLAILKQEVNSIVEKTKREVHMRTVGDIDRFVPSGESNQELVKTPSEYLNKWYLPKALYPLLIFRDLIPQYRYQDALMILLSKAARSARLAPHYELDFPKAPQKIDYYCHKHSRICHPTSASLPFIVRYAKDIIQRISEFQKIRTDAKVTVECGDARKFDYSRFDVGGVITSPPYVGLIDYHEQHRYIYELLGLVDRRGEEIGPKAKGNSKNAVYKYQQEIAKVLKRIADSNLTALGIMVVVVNDKFNLYGEIAEMATVKVVDRLRRRVDRRTGRRANGFFEDIFILK